MADRKQLETTFQNHGFHDFRFIDTESIVVAHWVRLRCTFGCPNYGKKGSCPPNVPSIEECKQIVSEYSLAAIFHFEKELERMEEYKPWTREIHTRLREVERQVFLAGCYKAFLTPFDACGLCDTCAGSRIDCKNPGKVRPGPDALGIDVYATVQRAGYHIQVLKSYTETMNRYAFLFIE